MIRIASSEVPSRLEELLDRVEAGEEFEVVSDGVPVAVIGPPHARHQTFASRDELKEFLARRKPDPSFGNDLRRALSDTTDDV
jgi:prevent-host-death family protein